MKELIYYNKNLLKPVGGPSGYLYNIEQELEKKNIDFISFLDIPIKKPTFKQKISKIIPMTAKKMLKKLMKYESTILKNVLTDNVKLSCINLKEYDIVHFHSTLDMYMVKDSLKDYKGKVLLTTHSPKVYHKEIIQDYTEEEEYLRNKEKYDSLKIIDEYAFDRANYIIFPTEESEECYYNTWKDYSSVKERNKNKYLYLPTGIVPININNNKKEVLEKYNIPKDAFIISYVGRHNTVKGYDQLKKIGEKVLSKFSNVYFLIAGKEEPLKGLKDERWIEIGWTDKPYEIINASDIFILPNKETYFDLILLEVMSIGKPVILTNTGGNKFFKKFDGALYYYDYDDIDKVISNIELLLKEKKLEKLGEKNKKIILNNLTVEIFTNEYINIVKEVKNGKK